MVFQGRRGKFTLISLHTFESVLGKKWTCCMESSSSSLLDKAPNYLVTNLVHYPKENEPLTITWSTFFLNRPHINWLTDAEIENAAHICINFQALSEWFFPPCFFLALWPNRNRGKLCFEILYHIAQHFSSENKYMIHKATESFRRDSFQNIVLYSYLLFLFYCFFEQLSIAIEVIVWGIKVLHSWSYLYPHMNGRNEVEIPHHHLVGGVNSWRVWSNSG